MNVICLIATIGLLSIPVLLTESLVLILLNRIYNINYIKPVIAIMLRIVSIELFCFTFLILLSVIELLDIIPIPISSISILILISIIFVLLKILTGEIT